MLMTPEQFAHYIEKIKEHEAKRLSTNERLKYWARYFGTSRESLDTDAGFDMSRF
jgi:hypothetical protein